MSKINKIISIITSIALVATFSMFLEVDKSYAVTTTAATISTQATKTTAISKCKITLAYTSTDFTGAALEPKVTVKKGSTTLKAGKHYSVKYSNNKNPGKASVVVSGISSGGYSGSKTLKFTINKADISKATIKFPDQIYNNGNPITPTKASSAKYKNINLRMGENNDYVITGYSNNKEVGTGIVNIKGVGNFKGTTQVKFKIGKVDLNNVKMSLSSKTFNYTGSEIKPTVIVKSGSVVLNEGEDYKVEYENNVNVCNGTAKVTVTGTGNHFQGTLVQYFSIKAVSVSSGDVSITMPSDYLRYNGEEQCPEPVVKFNGEELSQDEDYTLAYSNNINAGTGRVTVKGIGNFTGSKALSFKIYGDDLNAYDMELEYDTTEYTGESFKPKATINGGDSELIEGVDYTLTYKNNRAVGLATVIAKGKGNITGELTKTFTITDEINSITISSPNKRYNGKKQDVRFTVKAKSGTVKDSNYNVTYLRNGKKTNDFKSAGTVTVKVEGKGGYYSGSASAKFVIEKATSRITLNYTRGETNTYTTSKKVCSYKIGAKALGGGKIKYKIVYKDKYISLKNGVVSLKKSTPKGTYRVKADIKAKSSKNYKAIEKKNVIFTYTVR